VVRRTNLGLLVVLLAALATGGLAFGAGTGWARPVLVGHAVAGLAVLVLAPWKSAIVRRGLARRAGPGRWASVTFGILVLVAVAAGLAHATGAAAAGRGAGDGAAVADPARIPVTRWLDDRVQVLDPAAWRLRVRAGDANREWTYGELADFGDRVEAVLDCTGGWYARAAWEGARLDRLLPPGALERAGGRASLVVASATGYRRRLPLGDARALLLATRLDGRPLGAGHGFPARLVAPGRRGFWWVKWVTSIDLDPSPWWRQPPFPLT
jgi:DMSO/TMAO reductase YedYZ molybdopterin-dependent catalytic subunit